MISSMISPSDLDISAQPAKANPPRWITARKASSPEDMAFAAGAALSHMNGVFALKTTPSGLLRARLALQSAEACVKRAGRPERQAELRDAVHFLRPGDLAGPAGEAYLTWRRMGEKPVTLASLRRALPWVLAEDLAEWLNAGRLSGVASPVAQAAVTLERVLAQRSGDETAALILAETALAQALRWRHIVPVLSPYLRSKDLRKSGEDLRLACHQAVTQGALQAAALAVDLARRGEVLLSLAPKLRAKKSGDVINLFLNRDAVAPAELAPFMSDRAARRICDRLVVLGGVRELTGRDTFRLYGV